MISLLDRNLGFRKRQLFVIGNVIPTLIDFSFSAADEMETLPGSISLSISSIEINQLSIEEDPIIARNLISLCSVPASSKGDIVQLQLSNKRHCVIMQIVHRRHLPLAGVVVESGTIGHHQSTTGNSIQAHACHTKRTSDGTCLLCDSVISEQTRENLAPRTLSVHFHTEG